MYTELDGLILEIKKLFGDTAYTEETPYGVLMNTSEFFYELKFLLNKKVTIKESKND